jgi:hypothetical protein
MQDHLGQLLGGRDQLVPGHHLVDEAVLQAFLRGKRPLHNVRYAATARGIDAYRLCAEPSRPTSVCVSPSQASSAITRSWHCSASVRPTPTAKAVDRRDQRLVEVHRAGLAAAAPVERGIGGILVRRAFAFRLVLGEELDVAAGAERLAVAGDDADVDIRIASDVEPARAQVPGRHRYAARCARRAG